MKIFHQIKIVVTENVQYYSVAMVGHLIGTRFGGAISPPLKRNRNTQTQHPPDHLAAHTTQPTRLQHALQPKPKAHRQRALAPHLQDPADNTSLSSVIDGSPLRGSCSLLPLSSHLASSLNPATERSSTRADLLLL